MLIPIWILVHIPLNGLNIPLSNIHALREGQETYLQVQKQNASNV